MSAALTKSPAQSMEIALVLQGGGALGAYEYGGISGLFDVIDEAAGMGHKVTLKAVTGVSIGGAAAQPFNAISAVPEPASASLLITGLLAAGGFVMRRRQMA